MDATLCSAGGWAARYATGAAWMQRFALPGAMPIAEAGEVSRGGPIVDCSLRSSSLPGNGSFPSLNGRICLVGYPPGGYATGRAWRQHFALPGAGPHAMPRGERGCKALLCRGLGRTLCRGERVEGRLCSAGGYADCRGWRGFPGRPDSRL